MAHHDTAGSQTRDAGLGRFGHLSLLLFRRLGASKWSEDGQRK
jgi:hypothetical protein